MDAMSFLKAVLWFFALLIVIGISIFCAVIWVILFTCQPCCGGPCFASTIKVFDQIMRFPNKAARAMNKNCGNA
jgi:hypothetical protein